MPAIAQGPLTDRIKREVWAVEEHDAYKAQRNLIRIMGDVLMDVANSRHVPEHLRDSAHACRLGFDPAHRKEAEAIEKRRAQRREEMRLENERMLREFERALRDPCRSIMIDLPSEDTDDDPALD